MVHGAVENTSAKMTDLSKMIESALEEKGISVRELALKVGVTYEYMRLVVRGGRVPKRPTLINICRELGLDVKEAERQVRLQKMQADLSEVYAVLPDDLQVVAKNWDLLSGTQRKFITDTVSNWVSKQNKNN